ncbi:sulfotransferase family protein [Pontimonas sp.]|nr:sulfotransferase family protein [Pontimonas sp.]
MNENSEIREDAESAQNLRDDFGIRYPSAVAIESFKLTYFPVPRAGNTSTKVALAKALGYSLEDFGRSIWPHPTRAQGVHSKDLVRWGDVPSDYSENYAFTIVRHPVTRLLSAWSLLLVEQDPHLWAVGLEPPAELLISSEELQSWSSVIERLRLFVGSRYFSHLLEKDVHFQPQVNFFPPGLDHVFKIENGLDELAKTLRLCTKDDSLSLARGLNQSLFRIREAEISSEIIAQVQEIYSGDMAALGYPPLVQRKHSDQSRPVFASETEFAYFNAIRERNRRILALWEEMSRVARKEEEGGQEER